MGERDHIGPYELRGELGRGAMARVWRAWDPNLEREVAVKEPAFDASLPPAVIDEMGRRFVQEGRAAAKLNHPNIVTIHAADVFDGTPAIVMELVEGATLAELLDMGPLEPENALSVLDQLLDAVGYAHAHGVVHRDIKPDNVFVNTDGRVKLADFGVARVDEAGTMRATVVGTVLGTPGYMSPEQATGAPVDGRSDLFSVGVVGYEMLTGRNPFGPGDATTVIYRIVHEPAPEMPAHVAASLPAGVRPAIMAALAKDPAARPPDARAFRDMLAGRRAVPSAAQTVRTTARGTVVDGGASFSEAAGAEPGGRPTWLPYVVVALACAIVLAVVFAVASSGGGGGANPLVGGSPNAQTVSGSSASSSAAGTSPVSSGSVSASPATASATSVSAASASASASAVSASASAASASAPAATASGSASAASASASAVSTASKSSGAASSGSSTSQKPSSSSYPDRVSPVYLDDPAYLGLDDGYVAVFVEGRSYPYRTTTISVDVLEPETVAQLEAGVPCDSVEDALERVNAFIEEYEKMEVEAAVG